MIVCDSGPLISAWNEDEGPRHRFSVATLELYAREIVVPWPVFTEVDLFLRRRGAGRAALALARGDFALSAPTPAELQSALDLLERYGDLGIDLPDAVVMAMTGARGARAFTWDFRHFRAVVFGRGEAIPLLVTEADMPA